jgi:hypothetical protein
LVSGRFRVGNRPIKRIQVALAHPVCGGANVITVLGAGRYPHFRGGCLRYQGFKFCGAKAGRFSTVLLCVIKGNDSAVQCVFGGVNGRLFLY